MNRPSFGSIDLGFSTLSGAITLPASEAWQSKASLYFTVQSVDSIMYSTSHSIVVNY